MAYRIPITPRGGGTANYGQSVPSKGGIVMELTGLAVSRMSVVAPFVRIGGTMMDVVDRVSRESGWNFGYILPHVHSDDRGLHCRRQRRYGQLRMGMLRDRVTSLDLP